MICPNCGNEYDGTNNFCPNCNPINEENNSKKYTKQLVIVGACLVAFIIAVVLSKKVFNTYNLSWNEEYEHYNLTYVTQSNVKLGINFTNKEKTKKIKYTSTCGKVETDGLEINWNLKDSLGKCKITVSYKLKKISKEYQVIASSDGSNKDLGFIYEIDPNSDEDIDLDNLTNKQETEYGTNPELADTDMDGLDDYYEIFISKTDPIKKDTDGDGLSDYDEIELGFDPLKKDYDGKSKLNYDYSSDGITLSITGTGNIASTVAQISSDTKISDKVGLINNLYTFYTDGNIESAIVTIPYTDEELSEYSLNEDNLSIYYYNEESSTYEKVETTIDKENKTLTAKLTHFSNYVVGDEELVKESMTTEILFVLDNSWSMYSNEQYTELTGKETSTTLAGFDKEGVRFTLTSELVSRLSQKDYKMGLSEFRMDYANAVKIGNKIDSINDTLDGMNGKFITNTEGTNISNALTNGIKEFSKDADNKFIVILTDGQDSALKSKTQSIIETALKSNVKICSIGFGGGAYNTELSNISNGTGCKFYSSSNADGLTELFESIGAELDDDLVDIDGDGKADGILVADSGFVVNRDGFSFPNYVTNFAAGHCYGMATFAELYYKKVLPLKHDAITSGDNTSYAYNLNNTYFKKYDNLYDYTLQTNALKYSFGYSVFGEEVPADLRTLEGDVLAISKTYKEDIENSGLYDIVTSESSLSKKEQLAKWGVNYKTSEGVMFNEEKMQTSGTIKNEEKQMFNAIYASFIKQNVTTHYSSSMDLTLWLRNFVGTETTGVTSGPGFINILKTRMGDGDAPVISSTYSGGPHAINAISLVQDKDNPNYYYIGVYDNNYPGEKRYVDLECKKDKCVTKANDYYSKANQPVRVTPSLEYDLEYFNN